MRDTATVSRSRVWRALCELILFLPNGSLADRSDLAETAFMET
jgi:hypothetical protein